MGKVIMMQNILRTLEELMFWVTFDLAVAILTTCLLTEKEVTRNENVAQTGLGGNRN